MLGPLQIDGRACTSYAVKDEEELQVEFESIEQTAHLASNTRQASTSTHCSAVSLRRAQNKSSFGQKKGTEFTCQAVGECQRAGGPYSSRYLSLLQLLGCKDQVRHVDGDAQRLVCLSSRDALSPRRGET